MGFISGGGETSIVRGMQIDQVAIRPIIGQGGKGFVS